jgi:cyclic pyranopterin phosphate synthase
MRVSVTDYCNLSCFYCHREGQRGNTDTSITGSEIIKIVDLARKLDIQNLKLTGGEPLLRPDIVDIVEALAARVRDLSMTTNGTLLSKYASDLRAAGLHRINISVDSLDFRTYEKITGRPMLPTVISGVYAAVNVGLRPVKINMVLLKGINEYEVDQMLQFACDTGAILQLIEIGTARDTANNKLYKRYHTDLRPIERMLMRGAIKVEQRELHHRKKYFISWNGAVVQVEIVRSMHNSEFCRYCTRIRITADGKIKSCLYADECVDIVKLIREGKSDVELLAAFKSAIASRAPYW